MLKLSTLKGSLVARDNKMQATLDRLGLQVFIAWVLCPLCALKGHPANLIGLFIGEKMKIVFDSEKELEDWIFNKYQEDGVVSIDGNEPQHLIRQMNLGAYGICDLVSLSVYVHEHSTEVEVFVYELKKDKITADTFSQVSRYATAIKQSIQDYDKNIDITISCVLVGTEIDESCYILNQSQFSYYKPYFDPDSGVDFKELSEGWHRSNGKINAIVEILEGSKKEKDGAE